MVQVNELAGAGFFNMGNTDGGQVSTSAINAAVLMACGGVRKPI